LGKECIPKPFGKLEGSMEVDPVVKQYFSWMEFGSRSLPALFSGEVIYTC
jgi:hypothetical protein